MMQITLSVCIWRLELILTVDEEEEGALVTEQMTNTRRKLL